MPLLRDDAEWQEELRNRVVEHGIRVVAKYYTRIRLSRLASFLGLDVDAAEAHVARMVSSPPTSSSVDTTLHAPVPGTVGSADAAAKENPNQAVAAALASTRLFAKIDRPAGIVTFAKRKSADERVADFSSDVGRLLDLVEKTVHLVEKEHMVHGIGGGGGGGGGAGSSGAEA